MPTPLPMHIYLVCSDDNKHLKAPDWFGGLGGLGGRLNDGDVLLLKGNATPGPWAYLLLHVKHDGTTRAVSFGEDPHRYFILLHGTALGTETQFQPKYKEAGALLDGETLKLPELARELGRHLVEKAPRAPRKPRKAKEAPEANGSDGQPAMLGDMLR